MPDILKCGGLSECRKITNLAEIYYMPFAPHNVASPIGKMTAAHVCAANLIIYWGGFEATWKLLTAIFLGRVIFEVALRRGDDQKRPDVDWRAASWIWPWLGGCLIIGLLGQYGTWGDLKVIGDGWDAVVVAAFSLVIFYWAMATKLPREEQQRLVMAQASEPEPPSDFSPT